MIETTAEWKLLRQRGKLVAALQEVLTPDLMRGTFVQAERRCGKKHCACAKGGPRHPTRCVTVKLQGRTRNCYVSVEQSVEVRKSLMAYRRLWELLDELTQVNLSSRHGARWGCATKRQSRCRCASARADRRRRTSSRTCFCSLRAVATVWTTSMCCGPTGGSAACWDGGPRRRTRCSHSSVLKWLANEKRPGGPQGEIAFTISADMSEDLRAICERLPQSAWALVDDRVDETVACADVEFTPGNWPKDAQPLRYGVVRIRKKQGLLFAAGYDTKYLAVVSNRTEMAAPDLLRWHWQKAGHIERVHDITKNELGGAVPPCGRFGANAAWYRLSLMAYNVLSAMKRLALPKHMSGARPKRLRFLLLTIAASIVAHANRIVVRVSQEAEQIADLIGARRRLLSIARRNVAAASGAT